MQLEEAIKQPEFKNLPEKAFVNLIYTFNHLDYEQKIFFKQYDLTPQQYNLLRILRGQSPKPATINLIKERMLDKMCDASRIVERLRIKQLLKRKTCNNDRRSVDIMITERGLDLLNVIEEDLNRFTRSLMNPLDEEELILFNELLNKLRDERY